MSEKYQCIKTTAKDLKETYKNETMDKIFEDFAEALNDYQDFGCESCKAQDKLEDKIADLEHRLTNCLEPKFKIGQIVWHCYKNCNAPVKTVIESIDIEVNKEFIDFTYYDIAGFGFDEIMLFTTEAEAKARLEELKNGQRRN